MPNYQGELDGLCGPYAIVNAFEHCGIEKQDEIFKTACSALASRRWPKTLWDGTSLGDLTRMIKLCRATFPDAARIKTGYPFRRNTPKSNQEYWRRFDLLFEERIGIRCVIMGLSRPSAHWIVAHRESGTRISFVDTDPYKPFQRKNRSMLHAGSRNGHPRKWIIERSDLIVFETD